MKEVVVKDFECSLLNVLKGSKYIGKTVVVACSGGVDSLTLAYFVNKHCKDAFICLVDTKAVPKADLERFNQAVRQYKWSNSVILNPRDFARISDYAANGEDRCYLCKSMTYRLIQEHFTSQSLSDSVFKVVNGTHLDDLEDVTRCGIKAGVELSVGSPYVDAGFRKDDIRKLAGIQGLFWHDVPSSPCLSSRIWKHTLITPELLRAVDCAETFLRTLLGKQTEVRCRVREGCMWVEVSCPNVAEKDCHGYLKRLARHLKTEGYSNEIKTLSISEFWPLRVHKQGISGWWDQIQHKSFSLTDIVASCIQETLPNLGESACH